MSEEILKLDLDNLDSLQEQEKLDILSRDLLQELFVRSLKRTIAMSEEINKLTAESTEWESKCYDLQDRIDKAIEYIKQQNVYYGFCDDLLNILQNGSEEK